MGKIINSILDERTSITNANFIYINLMDIKGKSNIRMTSDSIGFIIHESPKDGRLLVIGIGCSSVPTLTSDSKECFGKPSDMPELDYLEEMYKNGFGEKLTFTTNAHIRVFGKDLKPEPVVFTDFADALAYLKISERPE